MISSVDFTTLSSQQTTHTQMGNLMNKASRWEECNEDSCPPSYLISIEEILRAEDTLLSQTGHESAVIKDGAKGVGLL